MGLWCTGQFAYQPSGTEQLAAGGESSLSGTVSINLSAKKSFGRWVWDNRLDLRYGHQWLGDRSVKTDDLIDLNTRLDRRLSDRLSISLMLAFRTQFAQGFEASVPDIFVSDFLAPAYTNMGVGLTYKAGQKLSLFRPPRPSGRWSTTVDWPITVHSV